MGSKLRSHIADHLESCVKLGTYRIPGFHFDVHTAGPSLTLQRPAAPDNLKHTAPPGEVPVPQAGGAHHMGEHRTPRPGCEVQGHCEEPQ